MKNKEIRYALRDLLANIEVDGISLFDDESVYPQRIEIGEDDNETLPFACIYINEGTVEQKHSVEDDELILIVDIFDKTPLGVDDRLDELLSIVRGVIKATPTIDGLVSDLLLSEYSFDADESNTIGKLSMHIKATVEQ